MYLEYIAFNESEVFNESVKYFSESEPSQPYHQ